MSWFTDLFSWNNNRNNGDFDDPGSVWSSVWSTDPAFNSYENDIVKFNAVFRNPALLKVFRLQCDLFSLGIPYVYKDGEEQPDDPFLKLIKNPNPLQNRSQFLWDYMFWTMIGTAYCYIDSNIVSEKNKLYFLDSRKIEFPYEFQKKYDKFIFSEASFKELMNINITYKYADSTVTKIPLSKILITIDLTNGTGNWFKGMSCIDALYKIISNSETTLDANNINTRFTGKFLVAGVNDPNDTSKLPMSNTEKTDIERKILGRKNIHAVKSMIDIKRFVENLRSLELGKGYLESYFLIGSMYGIPRDVLEAYNSSTYENQEKARASHVSYTLEPKGNDFFEGLSKRFGYDKEGKSIVIDWSHLPFMQVFERDRALTKQTQIQTMASMLKMNINIDDINEYLDTNFTINENTATATEINAAADT